jgi:hypothetical protein
MGDVGNAAYPTALGGDSTRVRVRFCTYGSAVLVTYRRDRRNSAHRTTSMAGVGLGVVTAMRRGEGSGPRGGSPQPSPHTPTRIPERTNAAPVREARAGRVQRCGLPHSQQRRDTLPAMGKQRPKRKPATPTRRTTATTPPLRRIAYSKIRWPGRTTRSHSWQPRTPPCRAVVVLPPPPPPPPLPHPNTQTARHGG